MLCHHRELVVKKNLQSKVPDFPKLLLEPYPILLESRGLNGDD
jgi:hypothetical protein